MANLGKATCTAFACFISVLLFSPLVGVRARAGKLVTEGSPAPGWVRQAALEQAKSDKAGVVEIPGPYLKGTLPLDLPENLLDQQYQQIETYFLRQIAATPTVRDKSWRPDFSSQASYRQSIRAHKEDLRRVLGLIPAKQGKPEIAVLKSNGGLRVEDVVVPIAEDFSAQALLFLPKSAVHHAAVIAVPPADETREEFAGVSPGMTPARWLTALLDRGVAVCIPLMVERRADHPLCQKLQGLDRRRILWRLGFVVGKPLVGLEVQQVLALREFLASQPSIDGSRIGLLGERQGGMTALYAAAADEHVAAVTVLDYFQQRESCWKEPVDRTLYGQLNEFGDAEVAALIAPRPLIVLSAANGPTPPSSVNAEIARARRFYDGLKRKDRMDGEEKLAADEALWTGALKIAERLRSTKTVGPRKVTVAISRERIEQARDTHFEALHRYLRRLGEDSDRIREDHWKLLATSKQERPKIVKQLHKQLRALMGVVPLANTPLNPRTKLIKVTGKFEAFDVFLDVVPGVQAYGQLLVPRGIKGRLPVVICQHGLGGQPKDVTGLGENPDPIYHEFGARLAERGYVVFAPYVTVPEPPGTEEGVVINPLVRQAAALGMMRTSIELAKLHRIVDFLQSLPFVNPKVIGYYGLSYGGYDATWMPPLEPRIKAILISGHFNDWRKKITDEESPTSFMFHQDEDFYNWNVLHRFTHLELIVADWPRPVCIEYGERDGVTPPAWHLRAWAEVHKWSRAWNDENRIVDDRFEGVHEIHGAGTFDFLDRWLRPEGGKSEK